MRADLIPVAIKAWDARTVFGDLAGTWQGLLNGQCIEDHTRVPGLGAHHRAMTLARSVAEPFINQGLDPDVAVVVGTSKGSIEELFSPPPHPPTSDNTAGGLSTTGLADIAAELSRLCHTRGPALTMSGACASGLHALIRGTMMIRSSQVRQALIVATEASVHPLFLGSFKRLGVLAKRGEGCRPFDERRTGFYMTEAAAGVLLEAVDRSDDADSSAPVLVERFALGGDATHLTGADPDGRVLNHLLANVIDARPVDLIHAHGTGTLMNDAVELSAIEHTIGDWPEPPTIYSHKAALGHSLGASGLLGVVLNCMCHTQDLVPPNLLTTHPLPCQHVVISNAATTRCIRRSIAVAAGFGGSISVVSLVSL